MSNTIRFRVDDMTCGHCVRTITAAIQATDPRAEVEIDLATRLVQVDSAVDASQLRRSIARPATRRWRYPTHRRRKRPTSRPHGAAPAAAADAPRHAGIDLRQARRRQTGASWPHGRHDGAVTLRRTP